MHLIAPKPLTILSIATSAALLAAAVIFGLSRDFGMFVLGIPIVGGLLILALLMLARATFADRGSRGVKISAVLLLLAPIAAYGTAHLRDRMVFVDWSLSHPSALQAAASKDGIITGWDSWGMAGSENDAYLVSNRQDDISDVSSAERWRVRMGFSCPIVATARMRKGIYVVTTYNCPLDAVVVGSGYGGHREPPIFG